MTISLKNIFVNLGLSLLSIVVFLILVELAARVFIPQWQPARGDRDFWVYDDSLGWANTPNQKGVLHHPDFSVPVSVNSQGMRDQEYPVDRVEGKRRILILGDSFGWGFGVRQEEVFSEVLEGAYTGVEVINASVSGYGTDQELLYFQQKGWKYRPDVVLLFFYSNDIDDNNNAERYRHFKPKFGLINDDLVLTNCPVPQPTLMQRFDNYILAHTYFFARVQSGVNSVQQWLARGEEKPDDFALTKKLLLSLNTVVRQHNSAFVVVSVPTGKKPLKEFLATTMSAAGIPYLPLDAAFSGSPERLTFEHDLHWNAAGHAIAARAIRKFLGETGIAPAVIQ